MTDDELARLAEIIAPKIVESVRETGHNFWVDPETHYQDHKRWQELSIEEVHNLKDLVRIFVTTRGLFWKAFLGCAIIGAILMAAFGLGFKVRGG